MEPRGDTRRHREWTVVGTGQDRRRGTREVPWGRDDPGPSTLLVPVRGKTPSGLRGSGPDLSSRTRGGGHTNRVPTLGVVRLYCARLGWRVTQTTDVPTEPQWILVVSDSLLHRSSLRRLGAFPFERSAGTRQLSPPGPLGVTTNSETEVEDDRRSLSGMFMWMAGPVSRRPQEIRSRRFAGVFGVSPPVSCPRVHPPRRTVGGGVHGATGVGWGGGTCRTWERQDTFASHSGVR